MIVKIFYRANQLEVTHFMVRNNNLEPWMMFFKQLYDLKIPDTLEIKTEDSNEIALREKNVYWKIKAQISRMVYRMYLKYGKEKMKGEASDF